MDHDFLDFCDKNGVIPCILRSVEAALQIGEGTAQNWGSVFGPLKGSPRLSNGAVVGTVWPGIVLRNCALILGEHVHTKTLFGVQVRVGAGALVDADQHQHWVQGNRRESIGRHSLYLAIVIHCDHGDAGGEATQRLAKLCLADCHKTRVFLRTGGQWHAARLVKLSRSLRKAAQRAVRGASTVGVSDFMYDSVTRAYSGMSRPVSEKPDAS